MQAGFLPGGRSGTSLDEVQASKFGAKFKESFSNRVFQNSLNGIESVSEKDIVYPKFATALAGMTLTRVPNGGFSTPSKIMLGTPQMTDQFANPNYFLQPGVPEKRLDINSGQPLISETGKPFLDTAQKTRPGHNVSTVKRAQQEAAIGHMRMRKARLAMYADDEQKVLPVNDTQAVTALPTAEPYYHEYMPTSMPTPMPLPTTTPKPRFAKPPPPTQFLAELGSYITGTLDQESKDAFWSVYWPQLVISILVMILLIVLIVVIAVAASRGMRRSRGPTVTEMQDMANMGGRLTGMRPAYRSQ